MEELKEIKALYIGVMGKDAALEMIKDQIFPMVVVDKEDSNPSNEHFVTLDPIIWHIPEDMSVSVYEVVPKDEEAIDTIVIDNEPKLCTTEINGNDATFTYKEEDKTTGNDIYHEVRLQEEQKKILNKLGVFDRSKQSTNEDSKKDTK